MDLEALVAPLEGDSPCGADQGFSAEFGHVNRLRRPEDPRLPQGESGSGLPRADWPQVAQVCEGLLTRKTKDLRLALWWTEASAQVNGYSGLANGLNLFAALCEAHWENIHPLPDAGDQDARIGCVTRLLDLVVSLSRALPVLGSGTDAMGLAGIEAAREMPGRAAPKGVSADDWAREQAAAAKRLAEAKRHTPRARIQASLAGVHALPAALTRLSGVLEAKLGAEGPGFSRAQEAAEVAGLVLEKLARELGVAAGAPAPPAATAAGAAVAASPSGPIASPGPGIIAPAQAAGSAMTRAQAIAQLRAVAEFFRHTEPHSPVAYLADRAARWGEMSLHEWLRTVVKEQGTLSQIEELLGVPPALPAESDEQ